MSAVALLILLSLLQPAIAQKTPSNGGFEAPPLQKANLAFYSIFSILGLGQLSIAVAFLFRTQSPHFSPGLMGVVTLIFLILSNGINVASIIASYTYDNTHHRLLSNRNIFDFEIGGALFNDWVDVMIFLTVAVILRDRYRSYTMAEGRRSSTAASIGVLLLVILCICVLFIVTTIGTSIYDVAYTNAIEGKITAEEFYRKLALADRFHYAYVGLEIGLAMVLMSLAIVVRRRAHLDKVSLSFVFEIGLLH